MSEKPKAEVPLKAVEFQFPIIMLRTTRGLRLLERIGEWKGTRPLGWAFLIIMPISAIIGLALILRAVSIYVESEVARSQARSLTPLANILIPGLNPYLPILYGWGALIVALAVHEGAHAALARSLKFSVKSTGLLLLLGLPIGAFAEVDEKQLREASFRKAGRVLAAGPGSNIVVAVAALFLLVLFASSMSPIALGIGVTAVEQNSPIQTAGIRSGDILTSVDSSPLKTALNLRELVAAHSPGDRVTIVALKAERGYASVEVTVQLAPDPKNASLAHLGLEGIVLQETLSQYFEKAPLSYLLVPTIASNQYRVPFSDLTNRFYRSPLGSLQQPALSFAFWLWFINFNVAIFNALPIYPLDGGQAFRSALKGIGGTKMSEALAFRLTLGVTAVLVTVVISLIAFPYILISR